MSQSRQGAEHPQILFCPFCRDSFEGRTDCPEHELTLVPIEKLPREAESTLERVTFFADPRLGRGAVLLGAGLVLLGFLAPLVISTGGAPADNSDPGIAASALEVAVDGAGNLWFTPGAAIAMLWILWRRRSGHTMRAARAAVLGLALCGGLPLIYTTRRIGLMAAEQNASIEWQWGLWLMVSGLLATALGSPGLGATRGSNHG